MEFFDLYFSFNFGFVLPLLYLFSSLVTLILVLFIFVLLVLETMIGTTLCFNSNTYKRRLRLYLTYIIVDFISLIYKKRKKSYCFHCKVCITSFYFSSSCLIVVVLSFFPRSDLKGVYNFLVITSFENRQRSFKFLNVLRIQRTLNNIKI